MGCLNWRLIEEWCTLSVLDGTCRGSPRQPAGSGPGPAWGLQSPLTLELNWVHWSTCSHQRCVPSRPTHAGWGVRSLTPHDQTLGSGLLVSIEPSGGQPICMWRPGRRLAITWTNVGILLIGPLGTNFSEMLIEIQTFSFKKIHWKMSSGKMAAIFLGISVLKSRMVYVRCRIFVFIGEMSTSFVSQTSYLYWIILATNRYIFASCNKTGVKLCGCGKLM